MKFGDKVKHRENGIVARVVYSSFGFSLHWHSEKGLHKTLGAPASEILKNWELIENEEVAGQ
jgi:hypothetical protein